MLPNRILYISWAFIVSHTNRHHPYVKKGQLVHGILRQRVEMSIYFQSVVLPSHCRKKVSNTNAPVPHPVYFLSFSLSQRSSIPQQRPLASTDKPQNSTAEHPANPETHSRARPDKSPNENTRHAVAFPLYLYLSLSPRLASKLHEGGANKQSSRYFAPEAPPAGKSILAATVCALNRFEA